MTKIVCSKCNLPLEEKEVSIDYLGFHFNEKAPRCPQCGLIYISEDLVKTKVSALETTLEEK